MTAMTVGRDDVFVGRQREMAQLTAALDDAIAGRGRLVMLVGEPGIGKTRTAEELAANARQRGAEVLWGHCPEERGAPPYWPWVQVARAHAETASTDVLRTHFGKSAAVLAEIVVTISEKLPGLEPAPSIEDPDSARFRLFDSVTSFLKRASLTNPLVVVLDNLHWADASSLRLLGFAAHDIADSRVLIVGTYRDTDVSRDHPLIQTLGDLTRERLFHRVLLRGLSAADTKQMVQAASGLQPPETFVVQLHEQTEGNPLFVGEVVRLLAQEGMLTPEHLADLEAWRFRLPEGVREVIGRRLDRLSSRCNEALRTAAVIGRDFRLDLLVRLLKDFSDEQMFGLLDEAQRAHIVEEKSDAPGRYQFTHALIQRTLASELSATRRVRLHAETALALEALYGPNTDEHAAELAHHFAEAEAVLGHAKAVKYCALAGEQALAAYAYENAATHYQRAWELKRGEPLDSEGAAVLFGLGRAFTALYKLDDAFSCLNRAFDYYVQSGDTERAIEVAKYPAPLYWKPEHLEFLGRAVRLPPPGSLDSAMVLSRYATAKGFPDYTTAMEAFATALAIARREGHLLLEIVTIARAGATECCHMNWPGAAEKFSEALRLTETSSTAQTEKWFWFEIAIHYWLVVRALALGDLDDAERHASKSLAGAQASGQRVRLMMGLSSNLWISMVRGDWQSCQAFLARATEVAPEDSSLIMVKAYVCQQTGDVDASGHAIRDAVALIERDLPEHVTGFTDVAAASNLPHVAWLADRPELCDKVHRFLRAAYQSGNLPAGKALAVNCALAVTAVIRRDSASAGSLLKSLEARPSGVVVGSNEFGVIHVAVARIRGLLAALIGQQARACAEFDEAVSFCRSAGYLPELAWSCHDYADMLLRSDRSSPVATKVKALIDEGELVAEKVDMKPLVSRFGLLRERLARWRGGRQEYPDGLTERQAEVLRLIAGGKTNSEIAKELVLSQRTVQRHVADIYTKIRARNRAEATAYALKEPDSLAGPPR